MDTQKYEGVVYLPISSSKTCISKGGINTYPRPAPDCPGTHNFFICWGCKGKFIDRVSLEEHACTYVSYICSCGMDFPQYLQMTDHLREHGDGDFSPWRKRQPVKQAECRKTFKSLDLAVQPKPIKLPQVAIPAAEQVCRIVSSPAPSAAPLEPECPRGVTVDLQRRFLPVVCMESHEKFEKGKQFKCAVCRLTYHKLDHLIEHHRIHTQEGVYGCSRCGLLLVSTASLPSLHRCGTFFATCRTRYTVGKVLSEKAPAQQKRTFFRCQHCPVAWRLESQLRKHEIFCRLGKHKQVNGPCRKERLRCNVCQILYHSVKSLQQHQCPRRPCWDEGQATGNWKVSNKAQTCKVAREWANPYSMSQGQQVEEVTFGFHSSRNVKFYKYQQLDNSGACGIRGELFNLRGLETSPVLNPVADEDCYVVESASTKASQPSQLWPVHCPPGTEGMNARTRTSLFQCVFCGQSFTNKHSLKRHNKNFKGNCPLLKGTKIDLPSHVLGSQELFKN